MRVFLFVIIYLLSNLHAFALKNKGQINFELERSKYSNNNFSFTNSNANEINLPDKKYLNFYHLLKYLPSV